MRLENEANDASPALVFRLGLRGGWRGDRPGSPRRGRQPSLTNEAPRYFHSCDPSSRIARHLPASLLEGGKPATASHVCARGCRAASLAQTSSRARVSQPTDHDVAERTGPAAQQRDKGAAGTTLGAKLSYMCARAHALQTGQRQQDGVRAEAHSGSCVCGHF